jgi:hypothetical protein
MTHIVPYPLGDHVPWGWTSFSKRLLLTTAASNVFTHQDKEHREASADMLRPLADALSTDTCRIFEISAP